MLKQISTNPNITPPVIGIYGTGGIGKTTFAASFPKPVFILTEDGTKSLTTPIAKFPVLTTFDDVLTAMKTLARETHEYKTVVVDSITRLEPLVWEYVCGLNNWKSIESPGYGRGYVEAEIMWGSFMGWVTVLQKKGLAVVLLAHDEVRAVNDPTSEPYDRFQMRLHRRAESVVREGLDMLGYLAVRVHVSDKKVVAEKHRTLHLHPSPAYTAKCRYPNIPDKLEIPLENGSKELMNLIKNGGKK